MHYSHTSSQDVHSEGKLLDHLLSKSYVSGVYLGEQNLCIEWYQTPDQKVC